ncbi:MAG: hypothetical protein R6U98_29255 [Pirellulaceae bacterium]
MDSCPTQAVLPLVGLAAEKVIRDQYIDFAMLSAVPFRFGFSSRSPTPLAWRYR